MTRGRDAVSWRRSWVSAVCAAGLLQIALGLAGLVVAAAGVEWARPTAVQDWQRAVEILAFGALAAHLLLGSRRDVRARYLGVLLLLIAVFFAQPPILALANALPPEWARAVLGVRAFTVDAVTPAIAWLFVRDFPRALESRRTAAFVQTMIALSIAAALILIAANVAIAVRGDAGPLAPFARTDPDAQYWALVFGLLLPVLPFALWRTRHAPLDERRRIALFAGGLAAAGILPVLVAVLPPLSPALKVFIHGPWARTFLIPLNLAMIFAVAATTTYSVVVQHVLDVRTVLRMAAQYWLASAVVAALAGIPFALIFILLYTARAAPLTDLVTGGRMLEILALLLAGVLVWRLRRHVMLAVDRLFFREPYDPEQILATLDQDGRTSGSSEALARSVMEQIERSLHPISIGILVTPPQGGSLLPVASALRPLPQTSLLAEKLRAHAKLWTVDLARASGPFRDLPEEDRIWLGDAGAAVLVPLIGSAGELDGVLALGAKRSELPYSRQDHRLLEAVGGATGIRFENRRLRGSGAVRDVGAAESRATECVACGCIAASDARSCPECGGALRGAALPEQLFGKFRLERRIGEGGMGIVYGATDVTLGRRVALKTLPRTSPEDADRLRREARAMAAITHPNLALILGAETWQGTPVLVLEYLARGTLETRIADGPIPIREVFEIAYRMARVLERLHASGLLHRDVKPSNVGFSDDDEPKLLDFGLVGILGDGVSAQRHAIDAPLQESGFAGTPLYMSPDALDARRPDPGFDLWGLAVVAFEAVTGRHPFERDSAAETLAAIRRGWTQDLRDRLAPDAAAAAGFFEAALSAERHRRFGTAAELAEGLRETSNALS
jgi:serine/threonine-protein kinase